MEYAVIKSGGKQYKVSKGDTVEIDRLSANKDQEVVFSEVLLWVSNDKVEVGKPFVENVRVSGKVLANLKGEKIRVAKFKAKARYRKVSGFRPYLTQVQITDFKSTKEAPQKEAERLEKPKKSSAKAKKK